MEWVTTTQVLDRLKALDDEAWETFVARFRDPIVRFSRSLGFIDAEAEDIAQEALLKFTDLLRQGRYDKDRGRLRSWLFGIVRNVGLNRARAKGRQISVGGDDAALFANLEDEDAARESFDQEWRTAVLKTCLERVRAEVAPRTFEAFERVVFQNAVPAEVAADLDLSRNAVFLAKHRILKRMRELSAQFEE